MKAILRGLMPLVLTALLLPTAATARSLQPRAPVVIVNNTGATLTVTFSTNDSETTMYAEYVVPPTSSRTFPGALHLGPTMIYVEARQCPGTPRIRRYVYHANLGPRTLTYGPGDFNRTVMLDAAPDDASEIRGEWYRYNDGHRVRFRTTGFGGAVGVVTSLDGVAKYGFQVGEETFRVRRIGPGLFEGQVKVRDGGGQQWWQPVRLQIYGSTMRGAGNWRRIAD